jgi:hypothetical protein
MAVVAILGPSKYSHAAALTFMTIENATAPRTSLDTAAAADHIRSLMLAAGPLVGREINKQARAA